MTTHTINQSESIAITMEPPSDPQPQPAGTWLCGYCGEKFEGAGTKLMEHIASHGSWKWMGEPRP